MDKTSFEITVIGNYGTKKTQVVEGYKVGIYTLHKVSSKNWVFSGNGVKLFEHISKDFGLRLIVKFDSKFPSAINASGSLSISDYEVRNDFWNFYYFVRDIAAKGGIKEYIEDRQKRLELLQEKLRNLK